MLSTWKALPQPTMPVLQELAKAPLGHVGVEGGCCGSLELQKLESLQCCGAFTSGMASWHCQKHHQALAARVEVYAGRAASAWNTYCVTPGSGLNTNCGSPLDPRKLSR